METWEYFSTHLDADIRNEGVRDYVTEKWPGWKPPQFAPQLLMPELNKLGAEGWELVSIQPVVVRPGGDHAFPGENTALSNAYFAVFKRRLEGLMADL